MKTHTQRATVIILKDPSDGTWLEYIGGDWGPSYSTTSDWTEASQFDNEEQAREAELKWCRSSRLKREIVQITTTMTK